MKTGTQRENVCEKDQGYDDYCLFLFLFVATQLARQLQQERTQVEVQ